MTWLPDRIESGPNTGRLPAFAWPGGYYPLAYVTRDGLTVCPVCANNDDADDNVCNAFVNWEDNGLTCDDCGADIPAAYA